MNPAAIAACTTTGTLSVGNVPDSLQVTTADGYTFTLNKRQLTHAAPTTSTAATTTPSGCSRCARNQGGAPSQS